MGGSPILTGVASGVAGAVGGGVAFGPYGVIVGGALGFVFGVTSSYMMDPATQVSQGQPLSELDITTASEFYPVPELLGTTKINGNVLDYWGQRAKSVYKTVGTGKGDKHPRVGYNYYLTWMIGVCKGPVDELLAIYNGEKLLWSGNLLRPESSGYRTITIEGFGTIYFYYGTEDQPVDIRFQARCESLGRIPIPFRGHCYALMNDCYLGQSNTAPNILFIVRKTPLLIELDGNGIINTYDFNPAHCGYYIIKYMLGTPDIRIDISKFREVSSILYGEAFGLGILFNEQNDAINYLQDIANHIDGRFYFTDQGKVGIGIYRGYDSIDGMPLIDENVIVDEPDIQRASFGDSINEFKVTYPLRKLPAGFVFFAQSYSATFAGRSDGTIFTCGPNHYGSCGVGLDWDDEIPITMYREVIGKFSFVDTFQVHSFFITSGGLAHFSGNSAYSERGVDYDRSSDDGPLWANYTSPVSGPIKGRISGNWVNLRWLKISVGGWSVNGIDIVGRLWGWGSNAYGMLGIGEWQVDHWFSHAPDICNTSVQNWTHVDVGQVMAVGIGNSGRLYAWGNVGWSGISPNWNSPTQIGTASNWIDVQTCEYQAVALNSNGQLFGIGDGIYGQFGPRTTNLPYWEVDGDDVMVDASYGVLPDISDGKVVSKVALGWYHIMILDQNGKLFVRGANLAGELGIGSDDDGYFTDSWTAVMPDKTFIDIKADYSVSMAIESNGKIWLWGELPPDYFVNSPTEWNISQSEI